MIDIYLREEFYVYDVYHITKAFLPDEEIKQHIDPAQEEFLIIKTSDEIILGIADIKDTVGTGADRKQKKNLVNKQIYMQLCRYTGKELAWGVLTGIRPTKLAMKQMEEGRGEEEIIRWLSDHYMVTKEKARLGVEIAKREKALLEQLDYKDGYSLYVGIPFCPSICSYCSFSSYPIHVWRERVEEYIEALLRELTAVGEASGDKKLNTVYIGGGTPTTLEPGQLDRLLAHMEKTFSYADLKEFTVEAGRPDSITREKLEILRGHNISRISVNPQTMQQKTLDTIGRKHTVQDVVDVFHLARELGFNNINMDLIAGLTGERLSDMEDTLRQIKELGPDSLTVHSLAIKRASRLHRTEGHKKQLGEAEELSRMIELAADYAKEMGLLPYYLYRQKNIAGNFENVGYAKVDKAGIYNILIMEEKQSIIAAGAGGSTKIVLPKGKEIPDKKTGDLKNIVRVENVKDVREYICRINEMIERKGEWLWR